MYTLVSAIGKHKAVGSRWTSIDISTIALSDLYRDYQEIYALLSNPFYNGNRTLAFSSIRAENEASSLTLQQYLESIEDSSLPVTEQQYQIDTRWALYRDAFRANYKIYPVPANGHINSNIPISERDWLSMTRTNTDYELFFQHCLVSVNGLIHRTDTDGTRVYVVDGMKSCRHSGENQIGIISFLNIGSLEFVSMTESMFHRRYLDQPLGDRVYFDIGVAKPGKYPILVVGGYLYLLDTRNFFQVSDTIYGFNIRNVPWRERFYESKSLIDLSSLEFEDIQHNKEQVIESELYSDVNIKKMFTLSQSFLVFVDNPNIFIEREVLRRSNLQNMYTSYTEPKFPLMLGYGKLGDYWRIKEDGQWALTVQDSRKWNYVFNSVPEDDLISYDNSSPPFDPMERSRCQFLKIGSDFLTEISSEE